MFFELDGILIDTGPPHVEAERATIRTFGFDDLAEDHPVRFGHGIIPGSKMIATHYGIDDAEALLAEYLNQWKRIATAGIDLLPGADAEMRSVAAAGISIALVTSAERPYADGFMKMAKLEDVFSGSVTLDGVLNLKPYLEPYLKTAKIPDVTPSTFVVFEDSVAGFVAARAAGMLCVGVGQVALAAEGGEAPDMAIASFVGFGIWNVRPF